MLWLRVKILGIFKILTSNFIKYIIQNCNMSSIACRDMFLGALLFLLYLEAYCELIFLKTSYTCPIYINLDISDNLN